MNTYNFNDQQFMETEIYKNFMKENPKLGYLRIKAYAANLAIPIKNMKVVVSKIINENNIIFFEGFTNESGMIEKISLPVPNLNSDDLVAPKSITYEISANYGNENYNYSVKMYDDLCVVQNIIVKPNINRMDMI